MFPLLQTINHPEQLRALPIAQLLPLADELRQFIVESVSKTGGHLSSNLGTVELTLALHYVFQTPEDRIIWDVGHQTYAHKILTGRREWMSALRMKDGPSGFPRRVESPFDAFGTAHSSTSISAALGMAIASQLKKENRAVVAVIGDGALSGGMAFEAMNNVGVAQSNMLVILNDNEMSISPAVGALHKYLVRLLSSAVYRAAWRAGEKLVNKIGAGAGLLDLAHKAEEHLKGMITPSTLFEELGFNYLGPIDGHDLPMLLGTLSSIRSQMVQSGSVAQPFFLHLVTKKGQGYKLAESDPVTYHGVTQFDSKNGLKTAKATPAIPAKINPPTFTEVFSDWLCDMASADDKLVGITPAMREGSGLVRFAKEYPHRYFDVGIAEQHALTFAGGLACEGLHPVVAIYSTFLQRGYDQLIHDVVLQNLPVLLAIDRAGLVGADGATHAGSFDLTYLSCLPNMVVMAPADEDECRKMLTTGYYYQGPAAVRYPRGRGIGKLPEAGLTTLEIGKAELRRRGERILILAFGSMVAPACIVGEKIKATVVNMRFVKPLDRALILELAPQHATIVTIEENALIGGAGSMVAQLLTQAKINRPLLHLGLPDRFIEHAEQKQQLAECGLDADSIEQSILQFTQD